MNCSVCGNPTNNLYCSSACKQKAYRARKKQEKSAQHKTISMYDISTFDACCKKWDGFEDRFNAFLDDYGMDSAIEMMYAVSDAIQSVTISTLLAASNRGNN